MGCVFSCCKEQVDASIEPFIAPGETFDLSPSSFEILKILGRGSFGKVCLVRRKDDQRLFAMKILKKRVLDARKQKFHTQTERRVLESSNCPFIIKLFYAFQTNSKLYLILEFMKGGELFFHLSKEGTFSEIKARFYIAEILIAINYLHSQGVIYRDLKPENVLLDDDGHVRLTDFGLSKNGIDANNPKSYTFCGTPEYVAPEIIQSKGHGIAVDYWSLGALLYYMLSGAPPFYSRNKMEIYRKVVNKPVDRLPNITEDGNNLLEGLLKIDVRNIQPDERLIDFEKIKKHAWFIGLDWTKVEERKASPPFKPKLKQSSDIRYFDKIFTAEPAVESIESELMTPSPNHYTGFTYQASVPLGLHEVETSR
jgi:serine/threonine protein kinase